MIQRVILGKIGRLRWKREYWRSVSVVKSDTALKVILGGFIVICSMKVSHCNACLPNPQEILSRSSVLRSVVKQGQHGYHWEELFDPLTDSFW